MNDPRTSRLRLAPLLACLALAACVKARVYAWPPEPATAGHHDQLLAVLWMQRAAEYRAACLQSYRAASEHLPTALADPAWTACREQHGDFAALPPAVIVDVDETVLDNSAFAARQIRAGATQFDTDAWAAWVRERNATAVPGALPFLREAAASGARVVYVTNRRADSADPNAPSTEESDTRENLLRLGFPLVEAAGEDVVLCKGELGDKQARRAAVARRFRIVMLVGDNLGDFVAGTDPKRDAVDPAAEGRAVEQARGALVDEHAAWWGTRWIVLPNPAYGGFESVLRAQHGDLREALREQP